ncbi:uncharacterized protein BJ171DRAFT_278891 [Polychytrium aggregatum]|uniref:uncharacterized protein n=1 Tax=Polychytrium aggregatum TaxID=110093 RepID=UPI0022FE442B|nr:uncharacterized protein BJ171DRAFT_278891 [Polychytrium aggregatum]KAI9207649.1 hypothetical protein BJ171DRAFT_278891 [Polychytrium aggregatum]
MDVELDLYHKSNADLEFSIADLKLKLKASDREVEKEKNKVNALTNFLRRFKIELNECAQQSSDPKKLKGQVKALYQKYCKENINEDEEEVDIQQEYARQREYLERTAASLKKKVVKDQSLHRIDNVRIMDENVALLKEINLLRKDLLGGRHKKLADKAVIAAAAESHGRPNMSQRNGSAPGPTITLPSVEHH